MELGETGVGRTGLGAGGPVATWTGARPGAHAPRGTRLGGTRAGLAAGAAVSSLSWDTQTYSNAGIRPSSGTRPWRRGAREATVNPADETRR